MVDADNQDGEQAHAPIEVLGRPLAGENGVTVVDDQLRAPGWLNSGCGTALQLLQEAPAFTHEEKEQCERVARRLIEDMDPAPKVTNSWPLIGETTRTILKDLVTTGKQVSGWHAKTTKERSVLVKEIWAETRRRSDFKAVNQEDQVQRISDGIVELMVRVVDVFMFFSDQDSASVEVKESEPEGPLDAVAAGPVPPEEVQESLSLVDQGLQDMQGLLKELLAAKDDEDRKLKGDAIAKGLEETRGMVKDLQATMDARAAEAAQPVQAPVHIVRVNADGHCAFHLAERLYDPLYDCKSEEHLARQGQRREEVGKLARWHCLPWLQTLDQGLEALGHFE